jgi:hypothetical protein
MINMVFALSFPLSGTFTFLTFFMLAFQISITFSLVRTRVFHKNETTLAYDENSPLCVWCGYFPSQTFPL